VAEIDTTLLEIIKEHAVGLTGDPTRETLVADLGIDSFSIVEIIYEVEEKLGVEVPFNANENPFGEMKTVGDLIDALNTAPGAALKAAMSLLPEWALPRRSARILIAIGTAFLRASVASSNAKFPLLKICRSPYRMRQLTTSANGLPGLGVI